MFCDRCGREVSDDMIFCPRCGNELNAPNNNNTVIIQTPSDNVDYGGGTARESAPKRKRMIWIPILIVALITALLGSWFVVYSITPSNKYEKKLSLGDKYLSELKYAEAIAAFKDAIEINPKNPQGYSKLAEAYVGIKDYDSAMDALYDGYEHTDDQDLLASEADTCLEYVDILWDAGDFVKAEDVLDKRYKETNDDRLKQKLEKVQEAKRLAEEEAKRAAAEAERIAAEEAARAEAERIKARHDELLAMLGEGFDEGKVLQDFVFYDEYRNPVRVSDFLGKTVYFNFFTTWCPYCFYEIPDMQSVADKFADDAIVIMIDLGETVQEAKQYAKDYQITMPIYYLDSWQAGDLVIEGVPHSIIIDRFGRIQGVHPGMSDYQWMDSTIGKAVKSE